MLRIAPSRMQRRKILRDTRGRQRSQDRRSNVFHAMSSPFQPWAYLIFRWPPTRPVKAGNPAQGCQLGEGQRGCLTFLLRTMRYPIGLPDGAHHRRRRLPGTQDEAAVARTGFWQLQIVRRCDRYRFVVLPKRWIVERTLAWISRCRRLARDYERHARKAAAFVRLAMIRLMLRRLSTSP
jgi:hypothetical protein